jgi:N6-adenosine-specific RNA methylase IME4
MSWLIIQACPRRAHPAAHRLEVWGFTYKSHFVWVKRHAGTGYWNRNQHELLLIGTRGQIPAPAPGEQYSSIIDAPAGAHSAKPPAFAEVIEEMFPSFERLEMFARGQREGWSCWGNEITSLPRTAYACETRPLRRA